MFELVNLSSEDKNKLDDLIKGLPGLLASKVILLEQKENIWREKHKLKPTDLILYSQMKVKNSNHLIFMVTGVHIAQNAFTVDGISFPAGTALNYKELECLDLTTWIKESTDRGLMGVIDKFI